MWWVARGTVFMLCGLGAVSLVPSRQDTAQDRATRFLAALCAWFLAALVWAVAIVVVP